MGRLARPSRPTIALSQPSVAKGLKSDIDGQRQCRRRRPQKKPPDAQPDPHPRTLRPLHRHPPGRAAERAVLDRRVVDCMKRETIIRARAAAYEFVRRIDIVLAKEIPIYGSPDTVALHRKSMELTRALAEMRKS